MPTNRNRRKVSATLSARSDEYLKSLVRRGKAATISEAIDRSIEEARQSETRRKLSDATAAYYRSLEGENLKQEQALELAVAGASAQIDFDGE